MKTFTPNATQSNLYGNSDFIRTLATEFLLNSKLADYQQYSTLPQLSAHTKLRLFRYVVGGENLELISLFSTCALRFSLTCTPSLSHLLSKMYLPILFHLVAPLANTFHVFLLIYC